MEERVNLKAGLEIHQQLNTDKLFCNCPSILRSDEPLFRVKRNLVPVIGESGKIDVAAIHEKSKDITFIYEVFDTNCLVELDEEPPREINKQALEIALQISLLLNCKIFPVTQIMRKNVIDGSNTSGFQRTALVAHDGFVKTSEGIVGIETVAIEEDSARPAGNRKEDTLENNRIYKLDRLGIPLVEITTKPDLKSPEQVREAAMLIGEILRSCNVKRGIGTIRQDLNISIEGCERVEVKGFQDPKIMIDTVITESNRQKKLIEIHNELKKRKARGGDLNKIVEITHIIEKTECNFVKDSIKKGAKALSVKLEGFHKILGINFEKNKRFGSELSDYAKIYGVGGIIHSDENLSKYNFSEEEIQSIKKLLEIQKNDAFVIIVDSEEKAKNALISLINRANHQIDNSSIKEVRKSNEDATTSFLRPMPGEARMYPETDLQLLKFSKEEIKKLQENLPKLVSENRKYLQEFGLNDELIKLLLQENNLEEFKRLSKISKNSQLIAKCLTVFPRGIAVRSNENYEAVKKKIHSGIIEKILLAVEENKISEEDVRLVLNKFHEGVSLEYAINAEKIDLTEEIKKLVREKIDLTPNAYMGLIMAKFRGQVGGKEVMEKIKEVLK